ncbi:MAG: hypothetical protein HUK15_08735, partial [Bacteroidales bacterium]|nr:hypothetical protein [Bacteroidales bacterium]
LNAQRSQLEEELNSGTLSPSDMVAKSTQYSALIEQIDVKEMRWLELSELQ